MGLILHRLIQSDLASVLAYYRREGSDELAVKFYAEFEHVLGLVTANPGPFHRVSQTVRRARRTAAPLLRSRLGTRSNRPSPPPTVLPGGAR